MDYIVCFTTPEAQEKRKGLGISPVPNEEVALPFEVYQSDYNRLKRELRSVVDRLVYKYEPILDITPLTKLYSDILAEISESYDLKSMYHFGPLTWLKNSSLPNHSVAKTPLSPHSSSYRNSLCPQ